MKFRKDNEQLITNGDFNMLKNNNSNVFSFSRRLDKKTIVVMGNMDFKNDIGKVEVKVPKIRKNTKVLHIKGDNIKTGRNVINTTLSAGEIKIIQY